MLLARSLRQQVAITTVMIAALLVAGGEQAAAEEPIPTCPGAVEGWPLTDTIRPAPTSAGVLRLICTYTSPVVSYWDPEHGNAVTFDAHWWPEGTQPEASLCPFEPDDTTRWIPSSVAAVRVGWKWKFQANFSDADTGEVARGLLRQVEPLAQQCPRETDDAALDVVIPIDAGSADDTSARPAASVLPNDPDTGEAQTGGGGDPVRPEPWQAPDDGLSEEALATASGLILLLLGGGGMVTSRARRRSRPPGESLGDRGARDAGRLLLRLGPDFALRWFGITRPDGHLGDLPSDGESSQADDGGGVPVEALDRHFADVVAHRAAQGFHVRNRNLIDKIWNSARDPFWNDPTSGQCGEYAEWGEEWTRGFVRDRFGADAVVDTIVVEEQSTLTPDGMRDQIDGIYRANHAATRVILPDGSRYVLDFWDALGRNRGNPPRIVGEADWTADWMAEIGEGVVDRTEAERTLKNFVEQYGSERGRRAFRRSMEKDGRGGLGELLIRSWGKQPW